METFEDGRREASQKERGGDDEMPATPTEVEIDNSQAVRSVNKRCNHLKTT